MLIYKAIQKPHPPTHTHIHIESEKCVSIYSGLKKAGVGGEGVGKATKNLRKTAKQ